VTKVAVVVVATTAAIGFALRPELAGSKAMYLVIAAAYAVLAGWALYEMWDDGTLLDRLSPRWGDLSMGVLVAGFLFAGSWVGRSLLASSGTPGQAWLFHIYLQLGDAAQIERSLVITAVLLVVPILEEIVWRGMVLGHLTNQFGQRRAWPLAALLYAVSVVPSVFTLADPVAGKNPLLFVAALGCGIFWSFLASVTNRLPPVIISHIAFTYFSVTQFRAPGL
jgi:membrane protease YdiL (CAAX protease family)